ncbi:MAG TPA: Gfo/Idh/MocA family oxidoreductase [Armatimonadota bacterium]|jgi:predicted dehydrogenase
MADSLNRREFLKRSALAGAATVIPTVWTGVAASATSKSPNEKLNIAKIAVGGMGGGDLNSVSSENIVALCDVDENTLAGAAAKFTKATKYVDFRKMLDKEEKNIDAVVVSTPDHTHTCASVWAMRQGKHVYCQKPLTHSVYEARLMMETARKHKVATQMGTQAHADANLIRLVELVQSGIIGPVREVHCWTDRPAGWWPQGIQAPKETPPVPSNLHWDLWLGPAKFRPYNPAYLPFVWRGWWDFGTGSLGDMGCHIMDAAFWSLKLKYPVAVAAEGDPRLPDSGPNWCIMHYEFPKRSASLPAIKLHWYDGGRWPSNEVLEGIKLAKGSNGSVFVGDKGKIFAEHQGTPRLLPKEKFKDAQLPPQTIARPEGGTQGHYNQWIQACKTGGYTGSNFDYASPMTETLLLGNIAFRLNKRLEYDAKQMKATNAPEATPYIKPTFRPGWGI